MPRLDNIRGLEWQGSTSAPLPVIGTVTVGVGAPTDMLMTPRPMYTAANGYTNAVGNMLSVGATGPILYSISAQSTAGALRIDGNNTVAQNQAAPAGPYTIVIRATNAATGGYFEKQFAFTCITGDGLWLDNNFNINNGNTTYAGGHISGNRVPPNSDITMTSAFFQYSGDYNYFIPANYVYPAVGNYSLEFKSVSLGYDNIFVISVLQGVASTAIQLAPRTVSSVAKVGQIVGVLSTFNQNNSYAWTIINSDNGNFNVVGNADGTATITVAKDNPPQGAHIIRVQVANGSNTYQQDIGLSVVLGIEYPSTNITMPLTTGLTNWTAKNTVIGTPAVTQMTGTVAWSVTQNDGSTRWLCNATTGVITNRILMSATPEDIKLVATNGIDVCIRTFTISATETPTWVEYHCGPSQPYARINDASLAAFYNGVPAKIMIHASPNVDYYMGDNADYGGKMLTAGTTFPVCYIGVVDPITGELPIIGGGGGFYYNGFLDCSYNGNDRDTRIENLEITRAYYYVQSTLQHLSAILLAGDGMLTIRNCHIRNNDMGLLANGDGASIFIYDSIFTHCGDGELGYTHNIYAGCYRLHMERVLTYGCQLAHNFKSRANITECIDCSFLDGEMGRSSTSVDLPNGTDGYFLRCQFHKGAATQQANIIRYGEENNLGRTLRPVQRLVFDDCEFINHQPMFGYEAFNDTLAVRLVNDHDNAYSGPVISPTTGLAATVAFTNCRMFGVPTGNRLNLGGVFTDPSAGMTYLTEPPVLRFQSRLLNGAVGRAPTPNIDPCFGPQSGIFADGQRYKGNTGSLDVGVHEIRVLPSAPAGAVVARMKMWGSQAGLAPYTAGTTWSLLSYTGTGGVAVFDPNFRIVAETDGTARIEQTAQHAAEGVYWLWPRATAPDGITMADQPIYLVYSTVVAPTNGIPAAYISYP